MPRKLFDLSHYLVIYRKRKGHWHCYSAGETEPILYDCAEEALARGRRLLANGIATQVRFVAGPSRVELGETGKSMQLALPGSERW
jgi:hypothetical protein